MQTWLRYGFRLSGFVAAASVAGGLALAEEAAEKITYEDHVKPILRQHCALCHNRDDATNDLAVDSYGALMQGGAGGTAVEPGDPGASRLLKLIAHEEEPHMPPEQERLPDDVIEVVRKWIDGGALENSSSKAKPKKKQMVAAVSTDTGAPVGEPAMPAGLSKDVVVYTERGTATTAVACSPWAPLVAIGSQSQIVLYHTETSELLGVLPFPEGTPTVVKFSRNGSLLLVGGGHAASAGKVVVFDVKTGERVFEVGDELDAVLAADINDDHTRIALGGPSKIVRIYATDSGELLHEITKHTEWIYSVAFSPDGVLLATTDRNGGMFLWEAETAREYQTLAGHGGAVCDVAWRHDSNLLASCSEDGTIRLWEMQNGKQIKSWNAHGGGCASIDFARDGRIVSTGRDKVAKLWGADGAAIRTFDAFSDLALGVAITHDGTRVIATDWTGEVRVWKAEDGVLLANLDTNPPTLAMAAEQTAAEAAKLFQEAATAAVAWAEAERLAQSTASAAAAAAERAAAAAAAVDPANAAKATADTSAAEKNTALEAAKAKLAEAMAAVEAAQAQLNEAQTAATNATAAATAAAEKAAADKAQAEKLAADKAAHEQALAERQAAAQETARKAAAAKAAAAKAAAELEASKAADAANDTASR